MCLQLLLAQVITVKRASQRLSPPLWSCFANADIQSKSMTPEGNSLFMPRARGYRARHPLPRRRSWTKSWIYCLVALDLADNEKKWSRKLFCLYSDLSTLQFNSPIFPEITAINRHLPWHWCPCRQSRPATRRKNKTCQLKKQNTTHMEEKGEERKETHTSSRGGKSSKLPPAVSASSSPEMERPNLIKR